MLLCSSGVFCWTFVKCHYFDSMMLVGFVWLTFFGSLLVLEFWIVSSCVVRLYLVGFD